MRIRMAPRTHDSGMDVEARGSRRGRMEGEEEVGRIPLCWCWRRAMPRASVSSVRVSARVCNGYFVKIEEKGGDSHHYHRSRC